MKAADSLDIETHDGQGESSGVPGLTPRSSGVGKVIFGLAVLLIVAGTVVYRGVTTRVRAAADVKADTQDLAVPAVSLAQPKRGAPQEEIVLPGNIQAFIDAPIYARTSGYLKSWKVDIGGRVKSGQLLAEIDTPELDQQLQQARADLATAKANYDLAQTTAARYEFLLKSDSVAKQDVDNAVGDAHAKKAMVDSATDNVKRLEQLQSFEKVYAPFDGVLTERKTDIGQLIDSGSGSGAKELFHVAAINTLRVYVNVPQIYSPAAVPGVQSYLTMPQFPGRRFPGKLVRTSEAIDQASRTLLAEVDVANPAGEILPGAYAEVHLKLPSAASTVVIPVTSLIFRSEGLRVGVVRNGHAALIPITLGRDFGTEVEVVSGLDGSEKVITNPPDSLVDGQEVRSATPGAGSWGGE
ncbi:MAG TPA: efflux RND transporter periplasmic adaptor subunit [Terriglobia bacterium]|nr:efflux RND transporter periplasmic adaptor subunit [Terriglobia bacterium]